MSGNRKSIRLKNYNYSKNGTYYVTVCADNRKCIFGDVRNGKIILNEYGKITDKWCNEIPKHFTCVELDEYIIMPNHLHVTIVIVGAGSPRPDTDTFTQTNNKGRGNRAPTLGQIVAYFKYGATKQINTTRNTPGARIWQRNYYDHVIRDEISLNKIRKYIIDNPVNWEQDEEYTEN